MITVIRAPSGRQLNVGDGVTRLMGIINVTPDSFSDGGQFITPQTAAAHACAMVEAGAAVIDIGGESTRPGHDAVPAEEQLRRILPVLEAIRHQTDIPISIDTTLASVAERTLDAGADWINDTTGLGGDPELAHLVAERGCPLILMHRFQPPRRPDMNPDPKGMIGQLLAGLSHSMELATAAGIESEQILLDPGIGFGSLGPDNPVILANLDSLIHLQRPLVVGPSRKSFIGDLTGRDVSQRVYGTAATVTAAILAGVEILRVHDIAEMHDVALVADAIRAGSVT